MDSALAIINLIPFLLSAFMAVPAVREQLKQRELTWLAAGTMGVLFVWLLTYIPNIDGEPVELVIDWVPQAGLSLSWYLDPLSLMFGLIITGVGIAVFLYAGYYLEKPKKITRFYAFLGTFAGAMLALVMAGNIITLFIAWELTSIMSYMLIGFYGGDEGEKGAEARYAASRALVITGAGGLALLLGLLLLGTATNSIISDELTNPAPIEEQIGGEGEARGAMDLLIVEEGDDHGSDDEPATPISELAEATAQPLLGFQLKTVLNDNLRDPLQDHPWYAAIVILIMIGCFSKSAQFPFHFWLPGAMTAPSPASAYLHSATMVKAGIYLLFRLYDPLHGSDLWTVGLMGTGLTTMMIGALFAIRKRDLKGLLAYSTISKLGVIVALIGVPESHGLKAAAVSIIAHALYKGTFFLLAGTIEHATGTRNLDELGGLRKRMPAVFLIAATVGISMAGVPPMVGFAAKEFLLDELLPYGEVTTVIPIVIAFTASVLTVVAAMLYVWDAFISTKNEQDYHHFHAPHPLMNAGPALLAAASVILGLGIDPLLSPILDPLLGGTSLYIIPPELNPAENTAWALSIGVLVLGPLLFSLRGYWLTGPWINMPSGAQIYAGIIAGVEWTADQLLKSQNGKVRYYLVIILGSISGLMLFGGFDSFRGLDLALDSAEEVLDVLLLILTIGSTLAAIILKQQMLAALAMGVSGYAIGGIFLLDPAPDVALVQFLVETLATVLIVLMIARIAVKQRQHAMDVLWEEKDRFGLIRDIVISAIIGVSVGLFILAAVDDRAARIEAINAADIQVAGEVEIREIARPIAVWHLENAYNETGVVDVVAAIVTDFRGMDTLLEITVFATAALGVLTIMTQPAGEELLEGKRITGVMRAVMGDEIIATDDAENDTDPPETKDTAHKKPGQPGPNDYGAVGDQYDVPRLSTPLTRTIATLVLPFSLIISVYHLLYGGDGPGDGFTAGVVSGLAVALWYVVFGYYEARMRLSWLRAGRLIIVGLSLAFANALVNLLVSGSFLRIIDIGTGPGDIHLASTLFFELAIFLTVFGGVTLIMQSIAYPTDIKKDLV